MKTALVTLSFLFIAHLVVSQSVPNSVVFKVRKVPADTSDIIIEENREPAFLSVEEPAIFQGGDLSNFYVWVLQNLKYPQIAVEQKIDGKVYVQFCVNSTGLVENVVVLRSADPALDAEAKRVVSSSPRWTPPKQGGKNVTQLFTLPIVFKLNGDGTY